MRIFVVLAGSFILLLLQTSLAPRMALGEIEPDFPLLLVSYFAIHRGVFQGSIGGFIIGFIQDLFNPELLGLNALTKSIAGYVLGVAGKKVEADNLVFLLALLSSAAVIHDFVYLLFFTNLHLGKLFSVWITVSIPSALYTAVVGAIVHKFVMFLDSKVVRAFGKARP